MTSLRDAIGDVYAQVRAPSWAAPNLDALADVLRDLSWLPTTPLRIRLPPGLPVADQRRLRTVLEQMALETAGGARPITVDPA